MSGSFFESVQFETGQSLSSDMPDVQSLSFSSEPLNINIGNPWDPPGGGTDISSILSDVALPEIYVSAFTIASSNDGRVSISALNKILNISGLPHASIEKILNCAVPTNNTRVNRGEFNVALALVALAQKNMDVSVENLIEHKQDLPEPILNNLESVNFNRNLSFSAISSRPPALPSLQADDPWAIPSGNGYADIQYTVETPSQFRSSVMQPPITRNSISDDEFQWFMDVDVISIKFAPEREGFLFKHVNYIVESQRRETSVVRRYSDFWWLMECLVKRYPFRILPALPPKKIGVVNGFYFTVDETFLEKRRKGLTRFLNFITRHPVLRNDALVEIFLTEQSQIAEWRKNNTPDLEEEYIKKQITPEMEANIPDNLDERLSKVYNKLDDAIEHYRNMCNLMERMARRQEGMAADYMRYSLALNSLIEKEKGCYIDDCYNCSQVVHGLEQVSIHFQKTGAVMEDAAIATLDTVLENLKRHRDLLVSFRTFERRDRLAVDTIETLNSRIETNQAKLTPLAGVKDAELEVDRLTNVIQKDRTDIELQRKRKIFLRHCFYAELTLFHKSSAFISLLYQNFVNDQIKYSQQLYENWKSLSPKVYDMPIETNGFG
ncbi:17336_t:CDS:10 [Funneliformis caledonium]|uniref:Sorting nexin MVP1 n=1 Tax=Funneliformis caledonium TaxID=1117310 RepID=A0A9N9FVN4_9GLOM|nr:17336_t:CDS:10 [Funneliformis caledonium]